MATKDKAAAIKAINLLTAAGLDTRFVGGCVRDAFLGLEPKDFDLVCQAEPERIEQVIADAGYKPLPVGENFGIVIVMIDGAQIEIAPTREEGPYSDGRHPDWEKFGVSFEKDAERRDFTINALSMDLDGRIYDYCGGEEDLKNRVLRPPGDPVQRLLEDKLRMLRAVRFACKGFELDHDATMAIMLNADKIQEVSADRIRDEFLKILATNPRHGLELLQELGLLKYFLPEVDAMVGCAQDPGHHPEGDAFQHTLHVVDLLKGKNPLVILAGVLHDVGKVGTSVNIDGKITAHGHEAESVKLAKEALERLHFSGKDIKVVLDLVEHHMKAHNFPQMRFGKVVDVKRNLGDTFDSLLDLQHADSMGNPEKSIRSWITPKLDDLAKRAAYKPLINGSDLIALGMNPKRDMAKFGIILGALRDMQDSEEITAREQAIEAAKQLIGVHVGEAGRLLEMFSAMEAES